MIVSPPADSRYEDVVPLLKQSTPSFLTSQEYLLVAYCDDLPGVVLAAYGQFLARLLKQAPSSSDLRDGLEVIHALEGWSDSRVTTAIRDEFIESFDGDDEALQAIWPRLSQAMAAEFTGVLGLRMSH